MNASARKAQKGSSSFEQGRIASESKPPSQHPKLPFACDTGTVSNPTDSADKRFPADPPPLQTVWAR